MASLRHPREVLLGAQSAFRALPVCDHYSGVEARMVKSLQVQAELIAEFGACVVDVTLDCEDGAPAGQELVQAQRVADLALSAQQSGVSVGGKAIARRVGVRIHDVRHPAFAQDVQVVVGQAAAALSYVMVPKVESVADVDAAVHAIDTASGVFAGARTLPVHVLVESASALRAVNAIASHPRVESVSFGLMDFVSAHAGAIPEAALGVRSAGDTTSLDQFHHPLVLRAKLEISAACHAAGKVPAHCVVTELRDADVVYRSAKFAAEALGYTRMWSIHPDQIRPIVRAFAPSHEAVARAAEILEQAVRADWAPISVDGVLHDRASYRYYWQTVERAHQTGVALPAPIAAYFVSQVQR